MNSRLLAVAALSGAVFVGSAFGVDPRNGSNPQPAPYSPNYGAPFTPGFTLPNDPNTRTDPFIARPGAPSTNRFINDGRQRFDMVSFPGNAVTPGTPLVTDPNLVPSNRVQPQLAPGLNPNPTQPTSKNRWRIGVYSRNTDTGVLIMRIVPNSPAAIAGLEPNDKIVAVGGYQVGIVNGLRHDLGAEFDLRCDENGATTLLVQDRRDGSLVNVDVQLEPKFATIGGKVNWYSEYPLPREAFAEIELRERVRPGAPMVTIAQTTVHALNETQKFKQGSVPFDLEYSQTDIDPNRQYFVTATITDNYQTLYATDRMYPVITAQNPRRVDLQMAQAWDWRNSQGVGSIGQATEYDQFVRLFEKYMGRPLRPAEAEIYRNDFNHGRSVNDALVNVIGNPEFYSRAEMDDRAFIVRAHQMYTGKTPNEQTIQYWLNQLQTYNGLRREFARDFISNLN